MISSPSEVGRIGLFDRSKMMIPSSSSSFCTCMLKVGWVTKQALAAFPKCLYLLTASTYSSCVRVMGSSRRTRP